MPVRIIIIHGMNNKLESFRPLKDSLEAQGFEGVLLTLPGHGEERDEGRDLKTAFHHFDLRMRQLAQEPYVVLAFSHGALYLQLWLEKNIAPKPLAQVLLAPALFLRRQNKIEKLISYLPHYLMILSQTPRPLRRYFSLRIWEYRTLFQGLKTYQSHKVPVRIPTLIMVDPKDELIDGELLKSEIEKRNPEKVEVSFHERPYLKGRRPGKYHILFHPSYFQEDWNEFILKISGFFKKQL